MASQPQSLTPLAVRRRNLKIVSLAAVMLSVGGLVGAVFVKSPEQLLADSAAPEKTVVTATVEHRILASTLVTRGAVMAATSVEVTPVMPGVGVQVLSMVGTKPGEQIKAGQVLLAVSGRPLIVLPGRVRAYRDLKPGDSGPDIGQLHTALQKLGYSVKGDAARHFGPRTKAAVSKLYTDRGYDAPDTGGKADRAAVRQAQARVDAAEQAVTAVGRRITAGEPAVPAGQSLPAELKSTRAELAAARLDLAELVASTGTMLPLAEFVFVPQLPARVAAFTAKVGDVVRAPLITLSAGPLTVQVKLRPDQAKLLRTGMPVKLTSETLGEDSDGVVAAVGEVTTDSEQAAGSSGAAVAAGTPYQLVLVTPAAALPPQWAGLDVRVRITSAQTDRPVLVVPLSAVSAGADGRTTVSVAGAGRLTLLEVRAGVSGDGYVEVSPTNGGLAEGDRVVVGAAP